MHQAAWGEHALHVTLRHVPCSLFGVGLRPRMLLEALSLELCLDSLPQPQQVTTCSPAAAGSLQPQARVPGRASQGLA